MNDRFDASAAYTARSTHKVLRLTREATVFDPQEKGICCTSLEGGYPIEEMGKRFVAPLWHSVSLGARHNPNYEEPHSNGTYFSLLAIQIMPSSSFQRRSIETELSVGTDSRARLSTDPFGRLQNARSHFPLCETWSTITHHYYYLDSLHNRLNGIFLIRSVERNQRSVQNSHYEITFKSSRAPRYYRCELLIQ